MANSIALIKKYTTLLDEVYKESAKTVALESNSELTRAGANTNEIIIPRITMQGLANYSRSAGYVHGDMTLDWQTVTFNFDRGRRFSVDVMDNEETQQLAFGRLAGEFLRTKVVPELDAFRFAMYASLAGTAPTAAALATGEAVIAALRAATNSMDEAEVTQEGRVLFITPTLHGQIQDLDTTKSREVLSRFSQTVLVPQTRFYTAIDQLDGTTTGEEAGGFAKDALGKNINFMVIHPEAVLQYTKHAVPKVIAPEANPDADAWIYAYRAYGLADAYENKVKAIYLHQATA